MPRIRLMALAAAAVLSLAIAESSLAVTSSWTLAGPDTDWSTPDNWDNGVPQLPGDVALLPGATDLTGMPVVTGPVSLGELHFATEGGLSSVSGSSVLTFDQPGDDPARILLDSNEPAWNASIATPWAIADGETLEIVLPEGSSLEFSGGLVSPGGDVAVSGGGQVVLSAASPDWNGSLLVDDGSLQVEDVNALAGSQLVRVAERSTLTFLSQYDTRQRGEYYVFPQIVLAGGALQAVSSDSSITSTLVMANIELESDSTFKSANRDYLRITGTITGAGGLHFEPIADSEYSQSVTIDGPTSYQGPTYIPAGMAVDFTHPEAMGDNSSGTFVDGGVLGLDGGGGGEDIRVAVGKLLLTASDNPYSHNIMLMQGSILHAVPLNGDDEAHAILTTPVLYEGSAQLGESPYSSATLDLRGGVQGTGSLHLDEDVDISGESQIRGDIFVHGRGPHVFSGKLHQAGDVYSVNGGALQLAGDLGAPRGSFYVMVSGNRISSMRVSHDNILEAVTLDPRLLEYEGYFDDSPISVVDGATLTISDKLQFFGGVLSGRFAGQQVLTKKDTTPGFLVDIAGSEFKRVDVERGSLTISGDAGVTPSDIHLSGHFSSAVIIDTSTDYLGDIYLHNTNGSAQRLLNTDWRPTQATLTLWDNTALRGEIFLGDQGSSIAGLTGSTLAPEAKIHGGELTIRGPELTIQGGQHTYTGATRINSRNVVLEGEGRLNSTSMIIGSNRLSTTGGRAALVLDNSALGAHNDRIPDATPVYTDGMRFELIGSSTESATETLGVVRGTRGISDIVVTHPDGGPGTTTLRINSLEREQGAMVQFHRQGNGARIELGTSPTLDNGLLGGWARYGGDDFATYGLSGVVAYSDLYSYATDLATATDTDNVDLLHAAPTLISDKNINALRVRGTNIDLNGHTLVLESGGLHDVDYLQSTISGPGELTAGVDSGGELFISGNHRIEADIVDNGDIPVGLTYSNTFDEGSAYLTLSGKNTYSGPTTVNSSSNNAVLEIVSSTALPEGGDVRLNGGDLRLNFDSNEPLHLGELVVRDAATVGSTNGSSPIIQPTSIVLESGGIGARLVGEAPIVKTGLDTFSVVLAGHSGPVDIQQGILITSDIGEAPLDDGHAVTIRQGAQLSGTTDTVFAGRKIRLDGGSIFNQRRGGVSAPIEVLAGGGTLQLGSDTNMITSAITGSGTLTVDGAYGDNRMKFNADLNAFTGDLLFTGGYTTVSATSPDYSGNVTIAGASVYIDRLYTFGDSKVTITPDGMLDFGSNVLSDIDLNGGVISFRGTLRGDLNVLADSRFFLLRPSGSYNNPASRLASTTRLHDGVTLSVLGNPATSAGAIHYLRQGRREQLEITGQLIVDGTATLTSFDSLVTLSGTIEPGADNSTLRLEGNNTFTLSPSIQLTEGRRLTLLDDGQPADLLFTTPQSISGEGILEANVTTKTSATIAPGDSLGMLTIDGDLTFDSGTQYVWEVDGAGASPGEGWDLLNVTGTLTFQNTAFVRPPSSVKLVESGEPLAHESNEWLIASAGQIEGFDPDRLQIITSGLSGGFSASDFAIEQRGNELYLVLSAVLPGDFNLDGLVDLADYIVWRNNLGSTSDEAINYAGDSTPGVGPGDYQVWKDNFGTPGSASLDDSAAAVPEPASVASLLGLGALGWVASRRRRTAR
ncbi:PEP-CTERM sorting domain-containing protein, partial [Aeoliella sp. ICT_H6.2]